MLRGSVIMFNATFDNISILSSPSVLLVEETGVPRENTDKLYHIFTNYTGSCNFNYYTIATMTTSQTATRKQ